MNHPKTELYFLLALLAGVFTLAFFIFKPFLFALVLAAVFATVFAPVHRKALAVARGARGPAALLAALAVFIVVVVPLSLLGVQILQEATQLYSSLVAGGGANELSRNASGILQSLAALSPVPVESPAEVSRYLEEGLGWLLQHLGSIFASFASVLLSVFIFLIALYYFFKDGEKLKSAAIALSPLQDKYDETIVSKLATAVNSVVRGSLAVALVQGILTTIGLALFGVPNPALWGSVAAVAALIPGVGTALVLLPAILYLYVSGEALSALGLLLWGVTAVGLVDNFLGPKLAERGMRIHPFLILLSILGGIGFFGPLGFLLGPLVLSLLFVLLEIYAAINKEHKGR